MLLRRPANRRTLSGNTPRPMHADAGRRLLAIGGRDASRVNAETVRDLPAPSEGRDAMFVSDILAYKGDRVVSVAPEDSLAAAIATLAARRIGAVLVLDADKAIAGILSERDVLHAVAREGAQALHRKVSEVMTSSVVTCDPDASIEQIMETMTERRFRHLPVVRQGRLCGMISIGDVVRLRLEEQRREADALREYITAA